jgi:hypothetical protein
VTVLKRADATEEILGEFMTGAAGSRSAATPAGTAGSMG